MRTYSRRGFLQGALAGTACLAMGSSLASTSGRKPNIVFILVDDLGWSDLGCYGNPFHETPNIDRLAREGMRFTDAYAACPVCSPTRASILCGQYPARLGLTDFIPGHQRPYEHLSVPRNRTQHLPLEMETPAEALRPAGYVCGAFGKWHLGGRDYFPDKQGFDRFVVSGGGRHFQNRTTPDLGLTADDYLTEALTLETERFIEAHREGPFFVWLAHYAVHIPLEARPAMIAKYERKPGPDGGINNAVYAAMVEHVDAGVGRIVAKLRELGLEDDTMVVLTSDNGGLRRMYTGEGPLVTTNAPLRGEKGTLYEGGIRVPLIVRWPGRIAAGRTCDVPVTSVDFYPTLRDAAGLAGDGDQALDGESLLPVLTGARSLKRDAVYWHYPHYHHSRPAGAVREKAWKLIEFYDDHHVELYNLANDIGETNDLAGRKPRRARRLREGLEAWRRSVGAAMPAPNPNHDPARAHEWGRPAR